MNKVILGTLNRGILFISILIAVMLIVSYVIAQNTSGPDAKVLNMINLTSGGKVTGRKSQPLKKYTQRRQ